MKLFIIVVATAALFLSGCASTSPVQGSLFADVKGPVSVTSRARGRTEGKACATSYFGVIAIGDASVSAAMENGGIKVVSHVEQHTTNIIGYSVFCTHVWGHTGKKSRRKRG